MAMRLSHEQIAKPVRLREPVASPNFSHRRLQIENFSQRERGGETALPVVRTWRSSQSKDAPCITGAELNAGAG